MQNLWYNGQINPVSPVSASQSIYSGQTWKRLRWSLPFLAAFLPIVLLSLFSYQVASRSVQELVESENLVATSTVSQMLMQEFGRTADIGHAIASFKGSLDAIAQKDDIAMRTRLRAIVLAYPQIDRVFISDKNGRLWTDYPQVPDAIFAADQSDSDWYEGLSSRWRPYISNVYIRPHDPENPAVAIALPIFNETGGILGGLVFEYKATQIQNWLESIHLGKQGNIFVIDENGVTVAHPNIDYDGTLHMAYADIGPIVHARTQGTFETGEYVDPVANRKMIASFQPLAVGFNKWIIVAQQPTDVAYLQLKSVRWQISLAGGVLTIFTIGMVLALAVTVHRNERLNSELSSKNQTLQDITSFVSHQLRAPVTAMRWSIEEIIDGDDGKVSAGVVKALKQLHEVAIQNGKLIDDILNVSRIDRGVIEVKTESVKLEDIAERALRDYRVALEKAGLSLTIESPKKSILVQADLEKMAEAVTNSISNAIKHTKKGGLTVTLRSDDQCGYIDVTDTGEGMTQEIMQNLFNRTGTKGANTDSSKSTGLGLYIARNFMQLQGGDITVTSTIGKGSTFTYSVPLAKKDIS